jgi:hypothetical protein
MTDHTIEAHIVVDSKASGVPEYFAPEPPAGFPKGPIWTLHFDGYDMSAWGSIVINRLTYSEE